MAEYRVAVIGCGRPGPPPGTSEGYAIGYAHAYGYQELSGMVFVAAADIVSANLEAFAQTFTVPATYIDYREMLERERPDIVSICTWPTLHAEMVIAAAQAGVRGILCEKPMALSLGEADRMVAACEQAGTKLSICHQRRLSPQWTTARRWIESGRIGTLHCMDAWIGGGWDLLSWGTHWIDMFCYFTGDTDARWVFAQIETQKRQRRYSHPVEDRSLTMIGFDDNVTGLLHIAPETPSYGMRVSGSEGVMELGDGGPPRLIGGLPVSEDELAVKDEQKLSGFALALRDLTNAIEAGGEPELSGQRGRRVTEIIMAAYASGLSRQLISLPYTDPDFPLEKFFATQPQEKL